MCRKAFGCEQDAKKPYDTWLSEQYFIGIEDCQIIRIDKRSKRGRPRENDGKTTHFEITGRVMISLVMRQEADNHAGLFILATNDVDSDLSMQFLLNEYKSQQAVERGFRFLKSPDFLTSSLFLKKPERIEALLMVMTCSLMVYASIEHLIRRQLANTNQFFPDMKKKPTQSPTAKWVFFCFQGIHTLVIEANKEVITNMKERHKIILNALGHAYLKFYT